MPSVLYLENATVSISIFFFFSHSTFEVEAHHDLILQKKRNKTNPFRKNATNFQHPLFLFHFFVTTDSQDSVKKFVDHDVANLLFY
jgi:SRSO17 transposase